MNKIKLLAVGCDPEVFLFSESRQEYVPSYDYIVGSKDMPLDLNENVSILCDNVMLEFTVSPASSEDEFVNNIKSALQEIRSRALPGDVAISKEVYIEATRDMLDNPMSQEFGCSPDYDAHTMSTNVAPKPTVKGRSAGGHVHVSFEGTGNEERIALIKSMDLFLGVGLLSFDKDVRRKKLYGKSGCFRPKSYGVEYRVLSSFWIHDEDMIRKVFRQTEAAVNFVNNGYSNLSDGDWSIIRQCINNNDQVVADMLIKKYNLHESLVGQLVG